MKKSSEMTDPAYKSGPNGFCWTCLGFPTEAKTFRRLTYRRGRSHSNSTVSSITLVFFSDLLCVIAGNKMLVFVAAYMARLR